MNIEDLGRQLRDHYAEQAAASGLDVPSEEQCLVALFLNNPDQYHRKNLLLPKDEAELPAPPIDEVLAVPAVACAALIAAHLRLMDLFDQIVDERLSELKGAVEGMLH